MLTQDQALQAREFVATYLELDENGVGKPHNAYPVHSLYLDGDDLPTYWMTINGDKNRFKLRLRFYNDSPNTPVFFEIKRRMNNCIIKQRGGAIKSAVPALLAGHEPTLDMLLSKDPKHFFAIRRFVELTRLLQARPKVHIAYQREAWVDPRHDEVRVTFDRDVLADAQPNPTFSTEMKAPVRPFGNEVILELKFTNRFPGWFRTLVEHFGLMQCGAAKYCEGVFDIGELRLGASLHHRPVAAPSAKFLLDSATVPLEPQATTAPGQTPSAPASLR